MFKLKIPSDVVRTWAPLIFYLSNVLTWLIIAITARIWHLVWLAFLPLIVGFIYLVKKLKRKK